MNMRQEVSDAGKAEQEAAEYRDAAEAELLAMNRAFDALYKLPHGGRKRALTWLAARLESRHFDDVDVPF